ncbi:hypothetical protein O181_096500, partial [Austropuccinia psidii MF-1]|nr:hypothetical protein [Austropuccinia psidii MF-1]
MSCTLCTKWGIPCLCSLTTTDTCDACRQAHKKCLFFVSPFPPRGQRSSCPRCPCEDSSVVNDDKTISERKWTPGPQAGRRERFRTISPVPQSINLSTPLLGHHPMVTSLLDRNKVIIWPMKDGNEQNPPNPPDKTLPFLVCLAGKPRSNPLQAQVAPNDQRNYSA